MSLYRFNRLYQRYTAGMPEVMELVFLMDGGEDLLVFRFMDIILVNAPSKTSFNLFTELPLADMLKNEAPDVFEITGVFHRRVKNTIYFTFKNDLIFKIVDEFHTTFGEVVPVLYYAAKASNGKAYIEWLAEAKAGESLEITDLRFKAHN